MKKIGAKPTMKKEDGSGDDLYTLPVIQDDSTGAVILDSFKIALYLDQTYPHLPLLFPGNSQAAVAALQYSFAVNVADHIWPIAISLTCATLNPPSQEYYRRKTETEERGKLEDWCPVGPKRDDAWTKIKGGLDLLSGFYDRNGGNKPFLFGDVLSYAEPVVLGRLIWLKMHVSEEEWAELAKWNDGRWDNLMEITKHLYAV